MLRLTLVTGALYTLGVQAGNNSCTVNGPYGMPDDDPTAASYVRVAFKAGNGVTVPSDAAFAATDVTVTAGTSSVGTTADCTSANKCSYNSTDGLYTLESRTSSGAAPAADVGLPGPGTLYTTHLDMAGGDKIVVTGSDEDPNPIELSGNYSACINMDDQEKVYMDKNLANSNQKDSVGRSSTHVTTETQNHQSTGDSSGTPDSRDGANQLCHDVLTGKILPPAPIECPAGGCSVAVTKTTSEGYTLVYMPMDWHYVDRAGTDTIDSTDLDSCEGDTYDCGGSCNTDTRGGAAISSRGDPGAVTATFTDTDMAKMKIEGTVTCGHASLTSFAVQLERVERAGTWGFGLDDDSTIDGPKDTEPIPSYDSGGSTATDAPSHLINTGTWTGGAAHLKVTRTAGGGPVGARVYNKHGDLVPHSARGMHADYGGVSGGDRTVVENIHYGDSSAVTIPATTLKRTQGSPPSPMYQFRVAACSGDATSGCDLRYSTVIRVIDISDDEPSATFYGDLSPKSRMILGQITIRAPNHAMGLQGYRLYPSDGANRLALAWDGHQHAAADSDSESQLSHNLHRSCPIDAASKGSDGAAEPDGDLFAGFASAPCGNNSPYSPVCLGKSCTHINVLPGSNGEWYISRFDNSGNQENPHASTSAYTGSEGDADTDREATSPHDDHSNTAQRNYGNNEYANVILPHPGWLTPIMLLIESGDTLTVKDKTGNPVSELHTDSASKMSKYIDCESAQSSITWDTDASGTQEGWTLIWQPDYPEVTIGVAASDGNDGGEGSASDGSWPLPEAADTSGGGMPMAQGASGLRIVSVYGSENAATEDITNDRDAGEGDNSARSTGTRYELTDGLSNRYVETADWAVPNVTCTPTTMHCPLPETWAHINYTTPSLYPEPAEGSCLQQKTGVSNLSGCSDKTDLDDRDYSANGSAWADQGMSAQNTKEEDNGQLVAADTAGAKHANWAGNCGDAKSYFWFEKIACGSTRTFLTDRSLIHDFVQLTPTWEDIQMILDLYYTTKSPVAGGKNGRGENPGITFINADYHVAPVLPPKVNCSCLAAMDAYASLLSVVSKTPTPGAPVTLDPEVLNTGTSKMVATLRMYQDPTYSIPASSTAPMPIVVSRFYLEVSTKFTRNRITISDCSSAHVENKLNNSGSLKPRRNYCDNSTFDTMTERSPNGVTHMDRLSMKKFKYQGTTDVFMQCKIRACAQQPCGECVAGGVSGNNDRQLSSVDLNPSEGEMFSPPTQVKVNNRDYNALTFGQTTGPASRPQQSVVNTQPTATTSQQQVKGTSMPIEVSSELVLSSVSAAWAVQNRASLIGSLRSVLNLRSDEELVITSITAARRGRSLSAGGVKVEFTVGVADASRANASKSVLADFAAGGKIVSQFSRQLDAELSARGQAPLDLPASALSFSAPVVVEQSRSSSGSVQNNAAPIYYTNVSSSEEKTAAKSDSNSFPMMVMVVVVVCAALLAFQRSRGSSPKSQAPQAPPMDENVAPDAYSSKIAHLDAAQHDQFEFEQQ